MLGSSHRATDGVAFREWGYHKVLDSYIGHWALYYRVGTNSTYLKLGGILNAKRLAATARSDDKRGKGGLSVLHCNIVGIRLYHLKEAISYDILKKVPSLFRAAE